MKLKNKVLCIGTLASLFVSVHVGVSLAADQAGTNDARTGGAVEKRDPFWPVGYRPNHIVRNTPLGKIQSSSSGGTWNEAMKKVVVNGVSSRADNEYFAVINGEVKRVGDTVSVRLGTSVYTWAVDGIEPPVSVQLRRVSVR